MVQPTNIPRSLIYILLFSPTNPNSYPSPYLAAADLLSFFSLVPGGISSHALWVPPSRRLPHEATRGRSSVTQLLPTQSRYRVAADAACRGQRPAGVPSGCPCEPSPHLPLPWSIQVHDGWIRARDDRICHASGNVLGFHDGDRCCVDSASSRLFKSQAGGKLLGSWQSCTASAWRRHWHVANGAPSRCAPDLPVLSVRVAMG